ncbi:hypothetical protein QN277_000666 [Acacia crassicarpa]|uniref:DUF4216 domain-containing protein n=2 Tax=Acacia crassicarpa TaxID=499986 RepID=A0AAE1THF6_9FABA|nr:hypothetical protein QN277_000666 [Acacia crassicarpa]
MHFSSLKDKSPLLAVMPYYGVIEEIWEVDYVKIRFPIFKCKWVNVNNGVRIDRLGFTLVDVNGRSFGDKPFIMADQAKQVFYITDQENKMWSVALQGNRVIDIDEEMNSNYSIPESTPFSSCLSDMNEEDEADNEPGIRSDHQEGIWEDITL